jgi:hypothetical protein
MKKLIAVHVVIAFFNGVRREVTPGQLLPPGLEPEALDDLVRLNAVRDESEDEPDASQGLADAVQPMTTEQPEQREEDPRAVQSAGDSASAGAGEQTGTADSEGGQAAEGAAQGAATLDATQAQDGNTAPPAETPASEAPAAAPKKRGSKSA